MDGLAALPRELLRIVEAHPQVVLFLALLVEEAGVPLPVPGDLVMVYYASRERGEPGALLSALVLAILASTLGANVPYLIARRFGPPVLVRVGAWLRVDRARVERAQGILLRRGLVAVIVLRVIPGLRLPAALAAGVAPLPLARYIPAVFLAAIVYWTVWLVVGVTLGPAIDEVLANLSLRLLAPAIAVGFALLLIGAALRARR